MRIVSLGNVPYSLSHFPEEMHLQIRGKNIQIVKCMFVVKMHFCRRADLLKRSYDPVAVM